MSGPTEYFFDQGSSPFYMNGFDGRFNFNGRWIDTEKLSYLTFNIWWSAVALTNGTLAIQGSNDLTKGKDPNDAVAGNPPDDETVTALTPHVVHGNSASLTVSTTASRVIVVVDKLPKLCRVSYTASAGGASGQFFSKAFGRRL
jgi:hypothetical protein